MSEGEIKKLVASWQSEVRRGALQLYLLSLIGKGNNMYGYKIGKELKARTEDKRADPIFEIKEGVLYPILRRLTKNGLLKGEWSNPENGGTVTKPRKYYQLTPRGKQVLAEMAEYWAELSNEMDLILLEEAT